MTTFTRTWDTSYKGAPPDTDDSSEGAGHIRNIKEDVYERMIVDHSWAGDANDGKHKKVTLQQLTVDPSLDVGDVALYAKPVGSKSQLFFKDQDGNAVQLTFAGQGQTLPAGVVVAFAGSVPPGGYLLCFGQTVSQTTYPALFAAIGTTYGPAVGGNFTLPDVRGRGIKGLDNMGGTPAGRISASMSGSVLGAVGGNESHTLTINEMPNHNHTLTDPGHSHSYTGTGFTFTGGAGGASADVAATLSTGSSVTGITIAPVGGGQSFFLVDPSIMMNVLIKT